MLEALLNLSAFKLLAMIHVFGVILGAGAAFTSDFLFIRSVRDGRISEDELKLLRGASGLVWLGLLVIVVSGAWIFSSSPQEHLASAKFLAKMTVVAVIIANGLMFHFRHLPVMTRTVGQVLSASPEFVKNKPLLLASGAVSGVSWLSAFLLGSLRSVSATYLEITLWYAGFLAAGFIAVFLLRNIIIPKSRF